MKLDFQVDCNAPYSLRYHLEGDSARRGFWLNGRALVVDLRQTADHEPIQVQVVSDARRLPEADVQRAVRHMLAADDSLEVITGVLGRDPRLRKVLSALPGLKPLRLPDLWTTLLRSIISQQISTAAARSIREKLSRRFGRVLRVGAEQVSLVPAPETVLELGESDFAEVGFSRRKAEYAQGIARAFLDGSIDAAQLTQGTPEQLVKTLSALRGVGVWTAECVGIFCIGHPDLLPVDDLGIQQAVAALNRLDYLPKPKEVAEIGKRWAGWRSYASIYLWGARNHDVLPKVKLTAQPKRPPSPAARSARRAPRR